MAGVQQALQMEVSTKSPRLRPESDTSQPQRESDQRVSEDKEPRNLEGLAAHGSIGQRGTGNMSRRSREEEAQPTEVQPGSFQEEDLHTKEAAEVAAAARFISQVDNGKSEAEMPSHNIQKPRLSSTTSVRDSILESAFNMSKSRTSKSLPQTGQKRSKFSRPAPLQLDEVLSLSFAEDSQSPVPERSSSKGAPSFDLARSLEPTRPSLEQTVNATQKADNKDMPPLLPESTTPFRFDFPASSEPRLSGSISESTTSQSPPTPPTLPSDDRSHRDIEAFALGQGSNPAEGRSTGGSSGPDLASEKRTRKQPPPLPPKDNVSIPLPAHTELTREITVGKEIAAAAAPVLRRKKSIFGWLQKRPEVDVEDLIDLYLTDEQLEEVKTVKRKPSKQRLAIFRSRNVTDPLPLKGG